MARNRIQFQKGLSEAAFAALYGTEESCCEALAAWRWPDGFICLKCAGREHCILTHRNLYQCNACRRQTSLTAGTIFEDTKLPLTTWFRAMDLITQTKQGISSIELGRRLGVTQTTAWKITTKLAEVMRIAGESERLHGRIEMDDAYLGGECNGGKRGRGSAGKKPIVVAVQTSDDGRPQRIKLSRIPRFKRQDHGLCWCVIRKRLVEVNLAAKSRAITATRETWVNLLMIKYHSKVCSNCADQKALALKQTLVPAIRVARGLRPKRVCS